MEKGFQRLKGLIFRLLPLMVDKVQRWAKCGSPSRGRPCGACSMRESNWVCTSVNQLVRGGGSAYAMLMSGTLTMEADMRDTCICAQRQNTLDRGTSCPTIVAFKPSGMIGDAWLDPYTAWSLCGYSLTIDGSQPSAVLHPWIWRGICHILTTFWVS